MGDPAFAACDMLRAPLKDPVQEVRSRAAWALGLIHDTSNRTIAALFAMIRSGTAKDRSSALHALGNLGKALPDLRPLQANQHEIIEALEDRHDDVRWGACYVLESLGLEPSRHMELLAGHLADGSERVRSLAISQMKGLAGKADLAKHIEPMCAVVCGGGHSAGEMCEVLALLGPSARAAVPALIEALRSDHPSVVVEAAKALWKSDRRADEALPHLARLFDDIVDAESACDAICEIGPAAAPLIDSVIQALQSDSWDLQWAAADALGQMASGDPHVVAALATALGHASPIVCSAAVAALAKIGEPALPALSDILKRHDDDRAEWAADALGRMGYSAKSAVDLLRSTLRSPRIGLASWSAIALAKIAGDAIAVPTLISPLGRSDRAELRQQAAVGLKAIGPPAASAVPALLSVRDDRDAGVRMAVDQALSAVSAPRH